jgi:lysophospholipase L1-like esterase
MDVKFETMELKEEFDRGIINVGNLTRIKRVMNKAISGEPVKVGFIGGSITAGAASTAPEKCYAGQVYQWWKNKFPKSNVEYINAGVGATTSKFGVARVEEDLLKEEPDMVFAEFSVNDTDDDLFLETFEGLVRRILLYPNEPALFMFNNVFYDDGRNAQRVHNTIGKYYNIPIVSIRESIYFEIRKGTIRNTDISADDLHPNDFGHTLVAGVIINLLEKIYDIVIRRQEHTCTYTVPSKPYTANRYFTSLRSYNRNTEPELKGFVKDETPKEGVWDVFRYGWSAGKAGSSIRFEIEAAMLSVQYRRYAVHPAPVARLVIDGDEDNAAILDANFDETWGDCLYLQDIVTYTHPGRHAVEITVTEEAGDKDFYLAALITWKGEELC